MCTKKRTARERERDGFGDVGDNTGGLGKKEEVSFVFVLLENPVVVFFPPLSFDNDDFDDYDYFDKKVNFFNDSDFDHDDNEFDNNFDEDILS